MHVMTHDEGQVCPEDVWVVQASLQLDLPHHMQPLLTAQLVEGVDLECSAQLGHLADGLNHTAGIACMCECMQGVVMEQLYCWLIVVENNQHWSVIHHQSYIIR